MPTRYLKPGVRDSESIESLSPNAEILYYRLIVTVDDFGRYDARPSMVKAACFPIRESMTASKIDSLLKELVDRGLILVYQVDSKPYLQLCKWDNAPRAKESKFPALEHTCTQVYADVCKTNTDAPLTVTVTETETKTETETAPRKRSARPLVMDCPGDVAQQVWDDWHKLRAAKRAPVTDTVVDGARSEAAKANMTLEEFLGVWCRRGSQGLEAAWLKPEERMGKARPKVYHDISQMDYTKGVDDDGHF